jgi:DNA (cytosine-5)-methyltransferase 1
MRVKIFSFFSGIGLLDLGFEDAGFEVVLVNEYHPAFLDAYKFSRMKLRRSEPEYGYYPGSIEDFFQQTTRSTLRETVKDAKTDGALVGFIGGPPCPDFSVGGKNKGRHGENGRLSEAYAQLILEQRPDFFLFENVKGLLGTRRHRIFFDELVTNLRSGGYSTAHRLINCIEYGVPQDRQRVILVGFKEGFLQDHRRSKKKRVRNCLFNWFKYALYPGMKAFEYTWPKAEPFVEGSNRPCPDSVPNELTVENWFSRNKVGSHPNAENFFTPRAGLKRFMRVDEGDDSRKSFKRLHRWRYSPTACYGNNEVHLHPYRARRISVAEALAIQSLPPRFQLPQGMTLSNMFKAVGNGVPYLAAKKLAQTTGGFLRDPYDQADSLRDCARDCQVASKPLLQLFA